jgi:hypothetical protein
VSFPDNEEQQQHAQSRSDQRCRTDLFISLSLFKIALACRIQTERLQDHSYQRRLRSSILVLAGSALVRAKAQVELGQLRVANDSTGILETNTIDAHGLFFEQ